MLVNTKIQIKNIDGTIIQDDKGEVLLVRDVLIRALLTQKEPEKEPADNLRFFEIAKECQNNDEIELTSEDVVKIKDRIAKIFYPLVAGQMFLLLEGKEVGL